MTAMSRSSAGSEFRRRIADPIAPSTRCRSASGIRSRATNCARRRLMRRWTVSSASMRSGSARRNRVWTSAFRRKGTSTCPRHARPSHVESNSSGSHVISTPARMRRWTSSRASSERCDRRRSWYKGPPRTREKSAVPPSNSGVSRRVVSIDYLSKSKGFEVPAGIVLGKRQATPPAIEKRPLHVARSGLTPEHDQWRSDVHTQRLESRITTYRDVEKRKGAGFRDRDTVQALHGPAEGDSPSTAGVTSETFHEG